MSTDVVVVGAGVMGSAIALELARSGRRVVVVDKAGGIGHGSTSASSAIIRFTYSTYAGVATSWEAQFCWRAWADELGTDVGELARFERNGMAMLDVPAAPRALYLPLFDQVGVRYEEWDSATLRTRVPDIDTGRYWPPKRIEDDAFWADATGSLGAIYTPDAGFVSDPQLAAQNLATAAMRHGAEFRLRSTVVGVESRAGRVVAVALGDGTRLPCGVVVNAAGPWSGTVNELAGVGGDFTIGVRPLRQEVAHLPAPPGYRSGDVPGMSLADLDLGVYLRGDLGDGLLVGGTEPACDPLHWLDDPDATDPRPTAAGLQALATRAAHRLTGLTVPHRPRGIVGVYDVADDWTPIYDRTELDGFYVAIGTSGNQFKNAPLVGRFLTAIIDGVESGVDHDTNPIAYRGEHTGLTIDLGAFSRRRAVNTESSGTVMG